MTPEDRIRRANEAQALLNNEYLVEAFEKVEKSAIEAMISARTDGERRICADTVRVVRDVRAALQSVVTTGQYAASRGPAIA